MGQLERRRKERIAAGYEQIFAIGREFELWTVLSYDVRTDAVMCRCICGLEKLVNSGSLIIGTSTGCIACGYRSAAIKLTKHTALLGMPSWLRRKLCMAATSAIRRCTLEDHTQYDRYGGRGIRVYQPWIEDRTLFVAHLATLAGYDVKELVLDRADNDGHYEPGNLRFVTHIESIANQHGKAGRLDR